MILMSMSYQNMRDTCAGRNGRQDGLKVRVERGTGVDNGDLASADQIGVGYGAGQSRGIVRPHARYVVGKPDGPAIARVLHLSTTPPGR